MITDGIIFIILKVVSPVLSLLKPLNLVVRSDYIEYVFDIVGSILYFLPVNTIVSILSITLTIWIIRIVVSFLRALWSILPIV